MMTSLGAGVVVAHGVGVRQPAPHLLSGFLGLGRRGFLGHVSVTAGLQAYCNEGLHDMPLFVWLSACSYVPAKSKACVRDRSANTDNPKRKKGVSYKYDHFGGHSIRRPP